MFLEICLSFSSLNGFELLRFATKSDSISNHCLYFLLLEVKMILHPGLSFCSPGYLFQLSDAGVLLTFGWGLYGQVSVFIITLQMRCMSCPLIHKRTLHMLFSTISALKRLINLEQGNIIARSHLAYSVVDICFVAGIECPPLDIIFFFKQALLFFVSPLVSFVVFSVD